MITVFTPTYNRCKELKNLYKSLLKQNYNNFEWLIVDDGSKDDTKDYINKCITEKKIKINYIYKENGGKPSAYNVGLENAKGNIFVCIDSDDYLVDNVLKNVEKDFKKLDNNCCGILYLCLDKNSNEIVGTKFPDNVDYDYYYNIYNHLKVKGDKCIFFKTEIAKKYTFPLIDNEKFVPEALIYNRIAKKYTFKLINRIIKVNEYLDNGYTNNYFNLVKRNPKGNRLYFLENYNFEQSLYNVYGYILFSIYSKYNFKKILNEHPAKIKVLLLYIPTLIISKLR